MQLVLLLDIGQQAPRCEVFLLVCEPGRRRRIVWQDEAGYYGQADGNGAFLKILS